MADLRRDSEGAGAAPASASQASSAPGHVMPGPPRADGSLDHEESATVLSPRPLQVGPTVTSHTSASGSETGWVPGGVFSGIPAPGAEPRPRLRCSALFFGDKPSPSLQRLRTLVQGAAQRAFGFLDGLAGDFARIPAGGAITRNRRVRLR